jgi:nucleotide-binding universal stress UspA family protein
MTQDRMQPVVVGLDGSPSSAAALKVAAAEALARGVPLRIVHAYVWPLLYACLINLPYRPGEWQPARSAVEMVAAVARRIRTTHPELPVQTAVTSGGGGPVLVDESSRAALVVVGARGAGGVAGLLAGPTLGYLSAHAHCPVLIVADGQAPVADGGHVCVGLAETPSSQAALRFACTWAEHHRASVEAVHVGPALPPIGRPADGSGVSVRPMLISGVTPADGLIAAGRSARLLVLGTHRPGRPTGPALGSLGRRVLRRCSCPVVLVPSPSAALAA